MGEFKDCAGLHPVGNGTKSIYRITKSWQESSVTYNSPWSSNGGDYNSSRIDQNTNSSTKVWEDFDVKSTIEGFLANTYSNYGFLIKFDSYSPSKTLDYISSENSNQDNRPKLVITYEIDTEAPVVKVEAPSAGAVLKQGASANIIWNASDDVGVVACALHFSDGTRAWELIDSLNSNPGTYAWTVPSDVTSTTCKVKVNAYDAIGNMGFEESGEFTIEPPASIKYQLYGINVVPGEKLNVKITNIQGREVASFETKNLKHISKMLTSLSSGVHIIHITTPNQKFSKQIRVVR